MSGTRVWVSAATDVGRVRSQNEDSFGYRIPDDPDLTARKGALLLVCDGMGGHAAGEVASQLAVETILEHYYQHASDEPPVALRDAFALANARIFAQANARPEHRGMGTTCVAAVLRGDQLTIAHVGDSRAYLLRGETLTRLTRDHSLVEEWVARGVLSADQAEQHPMANVITRALGHLPQVQLELQQQHLQPGDQLLLCSDGLSGRLAEATIRETLLRTPDLDTAVATLIHLANEAGGTDNISVIVARLEEGDPAGLAAGDRPTSVALPVTEPTASPPSPLTTLPNTSQRASRSAGAGSPPWLGGCSVLAALVLVLLLAATLLIAAALLGWLPGLPLPRPG
ncbi:MAG: Stp1/IreP family PP2C-type Ser/Thr phosphatase [Chloroflexi bacterium]|nr:Stp1/IreP family PP2C-type Ser/Thr phosphatase [Chloroflexota bacterium]